MSKIVKSIIVVIFFFGANVTSAQFVQGFAWTQSSVEIGVGEQQQLPYTYSSNTMSGDIFADRSNWVIREYESSINMYTVVDEPTVFSLGPGGVITGLKEGRAQIKGTGYIIYANSDGSKYLDIIVVSQRNEVESNGSYETANVLGKIPTRFYLSTTADVDFFKVWANAGEQIVFRVKSMNNNADFIKWACFGGPSLQQLGGGSVMNNGNEQEMLIDDWITKALGSGWYYIQFYPHPSFLQYFSGYSYYTVQAIVGKQTIKGDVDGNDMVDVEDVNAAINIILKIKTINDYPGDGDMDSNGIIDVEDVNAIINIILKL